MSKNGAAISAKRIISTAEMAKLGAITQFGPSASPNVDSNGVEVVVVEPGGARRRRASRASPATAASPGRRRDGEVDDDVTRRVGERVEVFVDRDAGDRFTGTARIDGGDENEIGVSGDCCTDGSTHPPGGSVDPDSHSFSLTDSPGQCVIRRSA